MCSRSAQNIWTCVSIGYAAATRKVNSDIIGGQAALYVAPEIAAGKALRELKYIAPIYDFAAEDITVFMICARLNSAPFLGGKETPLDMKKCPPAWLRALDSMR